LRTQIARRERDLDLDLADLLVDDERAVTGVEAVLLELLAELEETLAVDVDTPRRAGRRRPRSTSRVSSPPTGIRTRARFSSRTTTAAEASSTGSISRRSSSIESRLSLAA